MARSLIVMRSDKRKLRAQFRRVRERFQGTALKLEGPFEDRGDAVSRLSDAVTKLRGRPDIDSPIWAGLYTMGPQNHNPNYRSHLRAPFILGEPDPDLDFDCAGAIARTGKISEDGLEYRRLDMDALTLLTVAVLRRQGVPTMFAYQHPDITHPTFVLEAVANALDGGSGITVRPIPCILVMDENPRSYIVAAPYQTGFPKEAFIAGLEILDDEAVSALMKIKMAHQRTLSLMADVASRPEEYDGEGSIRAYNIGHLLHEGRVSWTTEAAKDSVEDAEALLGRDAGFESVRTMAEKTAVHEITCPGCHVKLAKETIFTEEERGMLDDIVLAACERDFESVKHMLNELAQSTSITGLLNYLQFAVVINEHIHSPEGCERLNGSSGN